MVRISNMCVPLHMCIDAHMLKIWTIISYTTVLHMRQICSLQCQGSDSSRIMFTVPYTPDIIAY